MMSWQLQEAKNRFSEVVREARTSGPQIITVRGQEAAVVISPGQFHHLTRTKGSLVEFLRNSPLADLKLDLGRSRDMGRELEP
jgi:prevent-host-death family protein